MNTLGVAVAWAALIGACTSVIVVILGVRSASRERHREHMAEVQAAYERGVASIADQLAQCRKDRDYWRDRIIRRMERE